MVDNDVRFNHFVTASANLLCLFDARPGRVGKSESQPTWSRRGTFEGLGLLVQSPKVSVTRFKEKLSFSDEDWVRRPNQERL
jgi:hypothetical protein